MGRSMRCAWTAVSIVISALCVASASTSNLYGFTDPDPSTSQTQWVRINPATGNITALWSTPLPIEPYVAAIDEPRGLLYAVIMPETAQGQKFSLVALSLASGEAHFN